LLRRRSIPPSRKSDLGNDGQELLITRRERLRRLE